MSHKLKGVAANLRIEDMFEILGTVNSSENFLELEQGLNMFYKMVDKLINQKDFHEEIVTQEDTSDEDDMFLSFKDDDEVKENIVFQDEVPVPDTPKMIEMPEFEKFQEEIEIRKNIEIHYDRAKVAREIGIDVENFDELLVDFVNEAKGYISEIKKAMTESDYEASKNSCIKLKRMCVTMRIDSFDEELNSILTTENLSTVTQSLSSIDTKLHLISSMEA